MKRAAVALALVGGALMLSGVAHAQAGDNKVTNYVPEDDIAQTDGKKQGLDGTLALAANVNLTSNRRVVGQVDGFSFLFGVSLIGGLDYINGPHEVRNTLSLSEAWARTPVLDEFVKANDVLDLESLYNYFIIGWFGAFGRLNLQSTVLTTEDVRAEPVTYQVTRSNGNQETIQDATRLTLADGFSPLTLNQSVGVFASPYDSRPFSIDIRAGFGARETFADGVIVLTDDSATPNIEATELSNVYQGGLELFVGANGALQGNRIVYNAGSSVLFPFINNDPEDRGLIDLTKVSVFATVGLNVVDWMIVQYQAKLVRDPQLLDELQVQNNVLLTFQYTFIDRDAQAISDADAKLEAEQKEKAEAEARVKQIEEENKKLRDELEKAKQAAPPAEEAPKTQEQPIKTEEAPKVDGPEIKVAPTPPAP